MRAAQLSLGLEHPTAGIPLVPTGQHHTSALAALGVAKSGRARSLERQVFDALAARSSTDAELCELLGIDGNTCRPRRHSLVKRGLAEDSGHTRATSSGKQAIVWKVVAPWDK